MFSHFSFLGKARSARTRLLWCAVVLLTVWFSACGTSEPPVSNGLPVGTWVSAYNETFKITPVEFTNLFNGEIVYSGAITNVRQDGEGAGYITIWFIKPGYEQSSGRFYVIHWRNLTDVSVELAAAYLPGTPDTATQAEAEATFTLANGCFAVHSTCERR